MSEPVRRCRVTECLNHYPHHEGRSGWQLAGEHVAVDEGQVLVRLDGPIDRTFGTSSELCVALTVEVVEEEQHVEHSA